MRVRALSVQTTLFQCFGARSCVHKIRRDWHYRDLTSHASNSVTSIPCNLTHISWNRPVTFLTYYNAIGYIVTQISWTSTVNIITVNITVNPFNFTFSQLFCKFVKFKGRKIKGIEIIFKMNGYLPILHQIQQNSWN